MKKRWNTKWGEKERKKNQEHKKKTKCEKTRDQSLKRLQPIENCRKKKQQKNRIKTILMKKTNIITLLLSHWTNLKTKKGVEHKVCDDDEKDYRHARFIHCIVYLRQNRSLQIFTLSRLPCFTHTPHTKPLSVHRDSFKKRLLYLYI